MSSTAAKTIRWTSADLEVLQADEWKRYEIIDGELFVTRAPHIGHQDTVGKIYSNGESLRGGAKPTSFSRGMHNPLSREP